MLILYRGVVLSIGNWEYNVVHPGCKVSIRSLILLLYLPSLLDVHRGRAHGELAVSKEGYTYTHFLGVCFGSLDGVSIVTVQRDACYVPMSGAELLGMEYDCRVKWF